MAWPTPNPSLTTPLRSYLVLEGRLHLDQGRKGTAIGSQDIPVGKDPQKPSKSTKHHPNPMSESSVQMFPGLWQLRAVPTTLWWSQPRDLSHPSRFAPSTQRLLAPMSKVPQQERCELMSKTLEKQYATSANWAPSAGEHQQLCFGWDMDFQAGSLSAAQLDETTLQLP